MVHVSHIPHIRSIRLYWLLNRENKVHYVLCVDSNMHIVQTLRANTTLRATMLAVHPQVTTGQWRNGWKEDDDGMDKKTMLQ